MTSPSQPLHRSVFRDITIYFCFILAATTLGPFQFGYHLAELNAPQSVITCKEKEVKTTGLHAKLPQCVPMDLNQFAAVTSIFTLGGLIGALLAGPFCNTHGRLKAMRALTLPFIIGPIFASLGVNIPMLVIGRFLDGVGAGAAIVVVPIYISETAPPNQKGLFGALTQIMCNLGILITQTLGLFFSKGSLWRIILAVPGVLAIFMFLGLALVPESPKWLAENGHPQEARRVLGKIRGSGVNIEDEVKAWFIEGSPEDAAEEESLLRSSSPSRPLSHKKPSVVNSSLSIFRAILHPNQRPGIIAVIIVMLTQQFTGINSIVMYSVHLLTSLLPTSAAILSVAISALNLIMTTLCAPLPDKIGRKTTLLLSTAGMGISSILLATGIGSGNKILGAAATLLFVSSFAVGLGPVPFILANELVDTEAVGATQSWALATNWIATFVVSQFFPIVNEALGEKGRIYFIFAANAAVLGGVIAWWVPETMGKKSADEVWGRERNRQRVE